MPSFKWFPFKMVELLLQTFVTDEQTGWKEKAGDINMLQQEIFFVVQCKVYGQIKQWAAKGDN